MTADIGAEPQPTLNGIAMEALRQSHVLDAACHMDTDKLLGVVSEVAAALRSLHDELTRLETVEATSRQQELPGHGYAGNHPVSHTHDVRPPALHPVTVEDATRTLIGALQDDARTLANHLLAEFRRAGFVVVKQD